MSPSPSKAVLVTGCSSGIGHATAAHLAEAGWTVYATARRPAALADLEARGCRTLALDVTDEESIRAAVSRVEEAEGAVGVLVNNAGYSQSGALEAVPIEILRAQFATNVFGLVRMCQLALPGMRAQRWGKIVNLSSMGGRFTFPGAGAYHASKHAVESLSDALRYELRGFGIDVIVIEPGIIRTSFADTAVQSIGETTDDVDDPYAEFNRAVARATAEAYVKGPLARLGGPPEAVAGTIAKAITARRPRARYTVTPSAQALVTLRRALPDAAWDALLRTRFPQPGRRVGSSLSRRSG